ncbi:MAG TPA: hypothetical protein VMT87_16820 [Vicinamibacteria bacterium]|nr:hypothetical protein [Vicinamibacteria bacterium]
MAAALLAAAGGCARRPAHPFVTYFNAEPPLTVRIPSNWTTEQVEQDGTWYRYFLAPAAGAERKPAVSVALLSETGGRVAEHAQRYLAGQSVTSTREVSRQGLTGSTWRFASADGATRYSLLLLNDQERVYGLYAQGEAGRFQEHEAAVDEMEKSLAPERPERYPEHRNEKLGFSVRVPGSWGTTRNFSGGGTFLMQFTSPALGAENGQTVHAALTLTSEAAPGDGSLDAFYGAIRSRLGEPFRVLNHTAWNDGYMDVERAETPMAVSRVKRFYRVHQGRGYTLAFEAREDVFHRVSRWCDIIAATLAVGPEVTQP